MAKATSYVTDPAVRAEVVEAARHIQEITGQEQWICDHPHGHMCNARCGPLDPPVHGGSMQ